MIFVKVFDGDTSQTVVPDLGITDLKEYTDSQIVQMLGGAYYQYLDNNWRAILDDCTRCSILTAINNVACALAKHGALQQYDVVCDRTNNPPEVVNQNDLIVDISYTMSTMSYENCDPKRLRCSTKGITQFG